jgi:hypothetical protein
MVEAYWMVKALVALAVRETKRENVKILQDIHILEGKFELYCRDQHDIKFRVNQLDQCPDQHGKGQDPRSPPGSLQCPIMVDNEDEQLWEEDNQAQEEVIHQAKKDAGSHIRTFGRGIKRAPPPR